MTTEPMTETEWNQAINEWFARLQGEIGTVTVPGIGVLLSDDPSYLGVENQTHRVASEDLIRLYAYAMGDPNPLWQDREYAGHSQYGGIIAPPTFEAFIAPPFTSRNFNPPYMGRLMSGVEHHYYKVIHAGDEFRIVDRASECVEKTKPGKGYRLFLVRSERKYINQKSEVAAATYGGAIALGFPPGKEDSISRDAYKGMQKRRLTQTELDNLHRSYEDEISGKFRRGAEILYWEDVVEGEELKPMAAGPLDIVDCCCFSTIYASAAFGLKWYQYKMNAEAWRRSGAQNQLQSGLDPTTGDTLYGIPHISEACAKAMEHAPGMFAYGSQPEGLLAKLVCNWMGDNGFMKKLDCQARNIWLHGHILWTKGKVARKYIENDEPLVDLELIAENQDGVLIMPATCTVRLESYTHPPRPHEGYER